MTGVIGSSRCSIGISSASTGLSPTACWAPLTASALPTSAVFQAGLINTAAAPSCQIARTAKTNSRPVGRHQRHPLAGVHTALRKRSVPTRQKGRRPAIVYT